MASTRATIVFWTLPIALVLCVIVLLATSVARRRRRGVEGITPGMAVYGADTQLVGIVDTVEPNGVLTSGRFIPGHAVRRVEEGRVVLRQASSAFSHGALRGDRTAGGIGPLDSGDTVSPTADRLPEVNVYQSLSGKRRQRDGAARDAGADRPGE